MRNSDGVGGSDGQCQAVVGSDGHYGFSSVGRKSRAPPPPTALPPSSTADRRTQKERKRKKKKKGGGEKKALVKKEKMPTITKLYSMEEVSKHNTKDDCWIVVHGNVLLLSLSLSLSLRIYVSFDRFYRL